MSRALVVGPRDELEGVIERLYALKLLHIVDHRQGDDGVGIGAPLPQASAASEILVKLRSIASALEIPEGKAVEPEGGTPADLREKILSLELNISEEDAARKKIQGLLGDLGRRIGEISPFAQLPLSLADYRGYDSLTVLVGKTSREVTGLEAVTHAYESFAAPGLLAVFVDRERGDAMRDALVGQGFSPIPVPEGEGDPKALLADLRSERARWERRLSEIEERLDSLRERYAEFLVAAKAHLETQVEKAEAPLHFAVTDHSFVIEGWVPSSTFPKLAESLRPVPSVFVSELEHDGHGAEPPVLLQNVRPLRPFEMLVKLFSIPSYKEIDPTFVVAIGFPLFFGLMIGDAGYGAAWLAFGLFLLRKVRDPGAFRDLIIAITWGGFFSLLFGLFFFAEAFGIPFHAPKGATGVEAVDWSGLLGFSIPIHATIEKLHQVPDFIVLSLAAAFVHLGIAYGIGFFNELRHSRRHAVAKAAWVSVLLGLFVIILVRAARWPGTMGYALWNGAFGWFPRAGFPYESIGFTAANPVPELAVYLVVGGLGVLLVTEGGIALMEIPGLMANMVSYARLAAVGVAKAAMAFAFNVIVFESFFFPFMADGNVVFLVVGFVIAFLCHMMIFLLGAISAAIQSIRLNYVEFFIKFFKGAGTLFRPFGERAKPEV